MYTFSNDNIHKIGASLLFLLVMFFAEPVFAAFSFRISNIDRDTLESIDDEVLVDLEISDLPSESYFRVAFQKKDGGTYFGYMKNDLGNWVKSSSDCKDFYHLTDKTTTSLQIPLKIGEGESESGSFYIKGHRYTASCTSTVSTNSAEIQFAFPTPIATPSATPQPTLEPEDLVDQVSVNPPITYDGIYISEAMVNPVSGAKEWVEFYNSNDFPVNLTDCYLDDIEGGGSSPKKFSLTLPAKSYRVFTLSSSMFNNDKDSVRLLGPDKTSIDGFEYEQAKENKTFGRTSFTETNFCLQEPSFEKSNSPCIDNQTSTPIPATPTPSLVPTITHKPTTPKIIGFQKKTSTPTPIVSSENTGEVMGMSTYRDSNQIFIIRSLSLISSSYSLLTIISILFKMTLLYGKDKKFLSSSLCSK